MIKYLVIYFLKKRGEILEKNHLEFCHFGKVGTLRAAVNNGFFTQPNPILLSMVQTLYEKDPLGLPGINNKAAE